MTDIPNTTGKTGYDILSELLIKANAQQPVEEGQSTSDQPKVDSEDIKKSLIYLSFLDKKIN